MKGIGKKIRRGLESFEFLGLNFELRDRLLLHFSSYEVQVSGAKFDSNEIVMQRKEELKCE